MIQASELPLSALLSKMLVAYTLEFDNEFERQVGTNLSLVVWSNLMRFLGPSGTTVKELADSTLAPLNRIKFELGCLERWQFITLQSGKREGWGSARGIKNDWIVRLTSLGQRAIAIWPALFAWVDTRWNARFGPATIDRLRAALQTIADRIEYELPQALPGPSLPGKAEAYPVRSSEPVALNLAALLARISHAE